MCERSNIIIPSLLKKVNDLEAQLVETEKKGCERVQFLENQLKTMQILINERGGIS